MYDFQRQYQNEFSHDERSIKLYDIAKKYHDDCEAYDRTVCTGPISEYGIIPANHDELVKINKYALSLRKTCIELAVSEGFHRTEVAEAIRGYRPKN